MKNDVFRFTEEYAKLLVKHERDFLIELGLNYEEGKEFDEIDKFQRNNAVSVATELENLVKGRLKLGDFFNDKRLSEEYMARHYFYNSLHRDLNLDFKDKRAIKQFKSVFALGKSIDSEQIKLDLAREKVEKSANFKVVFNEYLSDTLLASDEVTDEMVERAKQDKYIGKVERTLERRMFCVMLLKSIGKFNNYYRLSDVAGIGGGYFYRWENFGVRFKFGGKKYIFGDVQDEEATVIEYGDRQRALVEQINSACDSKYIIKDKIESK